MHMYWNKEEVESLLESDYPESADTFRNMHQPVMQSDFSRYFVMHR